MLSAINLDRRRLFFYICVFAIVFACMILVWVMTIYFGWTNTRFYTLTAMGDESKIQFNEDSIKSITSAETNGRTVPPLVEAIDLADVRNRLDHGALERYALDAIKAIDEINEYKIPNLTAIKKIKMPGNYQECDASAYSVSYHDTEDVIISTHLIGRDMPDFEFHLFTELKYREIFERGYRNYKSDQTIISRERIPDRNAMLTRYTFENGEGAFLQYTLSDLDTTLYVLENYMVNYVKQEASSTWRVYGVDEGFYFGFTSSTAYENVSEDWQPERPSEEFLMQFGVQRKMQPVVVAVVGVIGAMAATYVTVALCKRRQAAKKAAQINALSDEKQDQ